LFAVSCCDEKFDNPFDPASNKYSPPAKDLLIENFDDGDGLNLLGFPNSRWTIPDSSDSIRTFYVRPPSENVLRGKGSSLRIEFNVSIPNYSGGWFTTLSDRQGLSLNLQHLNLHKLTFWVKTEKEKINFEVALRDSTHGHKGGFSDCQTTEKFKSFADTSWEKVIIPISKLSLCQDSTRLDSTRVREINIGFSHARSQPRKGIIYLDEIAFER
jgi:hypothetical protein